jgi:uncharacterized protein
MLDFEWDSNKAIANLDKHGISFEEAKSVFADFASYIFDDENHSKLEKSELIIGISNNNRILMTCFTMRENKIRIINSLLSNKIEREKYEKNRNKN